MGRAPCCDKTKVKRGPWSPEEDNTLKNYVHKHGTGGNWIALPQKAGLKRCGKSCRLRWLNYLRPDIKHGGFTEEEDNIILTLYSHIGSRWSVIASHLQGRTDNDVKNYWNTKLKKKLLAAEINNNNNPIANLTHTASMNSIPRNYYGIIHDDSNTFNTCLNIDTNLSNPNNMVQEMLVVESSCGQFPLPGLMEIQESSSTIAIPSSAQEFNSNSSLSPSFSLENSFAGSWSGNGGGGIDEAAGYVMDFSSGISSYYYDQLVNGFEFQEKVVGIDPNFSNSCYSALVHLEANIPDTDQSFKGI